MHNSHIHITSFLTHKNWHFIYRYGKYTKDPKLTITTAKKLLPGKEGHVQTHTAHLYI